MRTKTLTIVALVALAAIQAVSPGLAGDMEPPAPPGTTSSYSLDNIYDRLDNGRAASQSPFTEPGSGPAVPTMHTLNEIYDLIGQRAPVPRTGLSKCYSDEPNSQQDCPIRLFPGQDGDHQRGVAWPQPRFTDKGDGTVIDHLTGLIWLKNADCGNGTQDWAGALSQVAQLNWDGKMGGNDCGDTSNRGSHRTDWRLPNLRELQSLVHYGQAGPAIPDAAGTGHWSPGNPFNSVQSYPPYWSSSGWVGVQSHAWYVVMGDGRANHDLKSDQGYVWPVRGGQ